MSGPQSHREAMEMLTTIYGETPDTWWEVMKNSKAAGADFMAAMREIAELRSKISFYESRIKAMNDFMKTRIEVKP